MKSQILDLNLPNNIHIPAEKAEGFLWGGRETGIRWLAKLPALVESICQKHNITDLSPAAEMRMNPVLFGESATLGALVIKLAQPHPEIVSEFNMAIYVSGHGYPRVLDHDAHAAWLLMERVKPGVTMQNLSQTGGITDEAATVAAARLMRESRIPVPADHQFPTLERWLKSLFEYRDRHGANGPLPDEQIDLALRHAQWLLNEPLEHFLLHGDFHHGNIIQGEHGWMLIDPKGLVGPTAFEVGPFFYNPLGLDKQQSLPEIFTNRLATFSEILGIDRVGLWKAIYVAVVLSDCWNVEDNPEADYTHHNTITRALLELPEASL